MTSEHGNTLTDEAGKQYVYDAWNHLVQVTDSSGTVLKSYTYNSLGYRITETTGSGSSATTTTLYYNANWQVVEEDLTTQDSSLKTTYVWSATYIDAMVCRDQTVTNESGSTTQRIYVIHDANFNVTAITDATGQIIERYAYDAYGKFTILNADGTTKATQTTAAGWNYLHQGGRYDVTTGLYNFRNRDYNPETQRWMQQDPLGYVDGASLYLYVGSNPVNSLDYMGLTDIFGGSDPMFTAPQNVSYNPPLPTTSQPAAPVSSGPSWWESFGNGLTARGMQDALAPANEANSLSWPFNPFNQQQKNELAQMNQQASDYEQGHQDESGYGWGYWSPEIAAALSALLGGALDRRKPPCPKPPFAKAGAPTPIKPSITSAEKPDRNGYTKAGNALNKHGNRADSLFPKPKGNAAAVNAQGQKILSDIMQSNNQTIRKSNKYGSDVFDNNTGRGARFDANGNFIGFIEMK